MTPQEQQQKLSQNIVDSLCHISERPDGWLPHIVFVEEEGEDGYPCYVRYNLIDYHADGTCTLQRPNTDVQETDRELCEASSRKHGRTMRLRSSCKTAPPTKA